MLYRNNIFVNRNDISEKIFACCYEFKLLIVNFFPLPVSSVHDEGLELAKKYGVDPITMDVSKSKERLEKLIGENDLVIRFLLIIFFLLYNCFCSYVYLHVLQKKPKNFFSVYGSVVTTCNSSYIKS